MLDTSKPVQTRDGQKATLIHCTARGIFPLLGYVGNGDFLCAWSLYGIYKEAIDEKYYLNLINVPIKHVRYINAYDNRELGIPHPTRTKADSTILGHSKRIACIRVEYEEGQFDD